MADPRLELKIGARVKTLDGTFGHVDQVILSPRQKKVVGLVVRTSLLLPRNWVVPTSLIDDVTEKRIRLRVSREDVLKQPQFNPAEFLSVVGEELGYGEGQAVASIHGGAGGSEEMSLTAAHQKNKTETSQHSLLEGDMVALSSGQKVWATDGRAGGVDMLLLDAAGHVRHFVIRQGNLLSRDVIVPVDWINKIDQQGVWLAMERAALEQLPSYRPDHALAEDVDRALWRDEVLRVIDYDAIDVQVHESVVTLRGYVSTAANKKRAENAARTVAGVLDVENRIITDEEVTITVAQALRRDERTRGYRIFLSARHGVVTLNGRVDSAETSTFTEEVVATVTQIRGIINYIQAPGLSVTPEEQRVLQPRIGQDVHAEDMWLGHVEKVIINPRHRRVTAFVARGSFPDPEQAKPGMLPVEIPHEERQVLIPINIVKFVTQGGVLLTINGVAAARHHDFDPGNFIPADPEWQPPYPYTHSDVLLDAEGNVPEEVAAVHMQSNTRSNR